MAHVTHWRCQDCGHCWPGSKPCPECKSKKADRLPSVTTVNGLIKIGGIDGLIWWAHDLGCKGIALEEARKGAADVGTVAHAGVEADLHGEPWDLDDLPIFGEQKKQVERCLSAWREWRDQTSLEMVASEVALTSKVHGYGGTLDVASVGRHRGIIDLKTGGCYPEHLMQVRAYGELWNEANPGKPIEEYHLLRLGKEDGSFHHHRWDAETMEPAWRAFQAALKVYGESKLLKKMAA
jgi:hypothetical protein